ncbi:Ig-like domain-containing protein, partial [Pseudomonas typographi]|nr:hypothetical protein [Pseudomonas typographi]
MSLASAQLNGEVLSVNATATNGLNSLPAHLVAADVTPPAAPSDLALAVDGGSLGGHGEAGATVTARDTAGTVQGTAQVAADGNFTLVLANPLANGQQLALTQADHAGNVSPIANLFAPDTTAPSALSSVAINAAGAQVTGVGEPGATVTVTDTTGVVLGTAQVSAGGTFSIVLAPPQVNAQVLSVQQADASGNMSVPTSVTAPDLTPPDAALNLQLTNGAQLSGTGDAGTHVRVALADGTQLGDGTVAADGTFTVNLGAPQANGQVLQVTLTDAAQNISPVASLTAPDTTAPLAPAALQLVNGGALLEGTGEAGASVTVTSQAGALLGTAEVAADGTFRVALNSPQQNGEALLARQSDAQGNTSPPAEITAPDLT